MPSQPSSRHKRRLLQLLIHPVVETMGAMLTGLGIVIVAETLVNFPKSQGYSLNEAIKRFVTFIPEILGWVLALVTLVVVFAATLRFKIRKSSDVKEQVANAFLNALEKSSFNPHRLKEEPHEHKFSSKTLG
jgi:hypothetical protein